MAAVRSLPPELHRLLIERPRLVRRLRRRFDLDVIAIEAPAGYGKSVLLAQALRSNEVNPAGVDHWICLDPVSGQPDRFATELDRVIERHGTDPLALVIDQIEHLDDPTPLLELRARELPDLHLVVAGRRSVPGLDPALSVSADQLEFTPAELTEIGEVLGGDLDATAWAGSWPAIRALALADQTTLAIDYAIDEVFRPATAAERARLVQHDWSGPLAAAAARLHPASAAASLAPATNAAETVAPPASERTVTIRLFGPATITDGPRVVEPPTWRRQRVRQLLSLVALREETSRHDAAELIWPALDHGSQRRNLSVTLSHLRRLQHTLGIVLVDERDALLRWNTQGARVDVHDALAATALDPCAGERVHALAAIEGAPYAELADSTALAASLRSVTVRLLHAGIETADALLAANRPERAARIARAIAGLDRFDPNPPALEARAADAMQDTARARSAVATACRLRDELGIEFDTTTADLVDRYAP